MEFNVSQLLMEASGSSRSFAIKDEPIEFAGGYQPAPFSGKVKLVKTESGVWISASLDTYAECSCSRCLTECREPVHIEMEEEALMTVDPYTGRRVDETLENADVVLIDQNHILDISEAVMQYFVAGVPMKPVCKAGCLGICQKCGTNRNERECDCDKVVRDSQWGPLLDLAPTLNLREAE
ncbi:MAG: hypothetical protein FJ319_13315 [SAR202 cluster bacterium]|nr:hypothetical protein [SAR202 cluster bacterium]